MKKGKRIIALLLAVLMIATSDTGIYLSLIHIWAVFTTAASNGSVNSMHDSYTPLGGAIPMLLMMLGEVVFGGTGCGLYGMLGFAIMTVFIAGLMVGLSLIHILMKSYGTRGWEAS